MFKAAAKLTMENAGQTLEAGLQAMAAGESAFDLSDLVSVDSSAVAVLLEWRRQAAAKGAALSFGVLPPDLQSLIDLYGVDDLLSSAAPVAGDLRHR